MIESMRDDHKQAKEDMTRRMKELERDAEEREKRLRTELHQARASQPPNGGVTIDLGGILGLFKKAVKRDNCDNHLPGAPLGAPLGAPRGGACGTAQGAAGGSDGASMQGTAQGTAQDTAQGN